MTILPQDPQGLEAAASAFEPLVGSDPRRGESQFDLCWPLGQVGDTAAADDRLQIDPSD